MRRKHGRGLGLCSPENTVWGQNMRLPEGGPKGQRDGAENVSQGRRWCPQKASVELATVVELSPVRGPLRVIGHNSELTLWGFPGDSVVEGLPANAGDTGLSMIQEDPTCHRATKPWATTIGPMLESLKPHLHSPRAWNYWACAPRAHAPQQEKPPHWEAHRPQLERSRSSNKDPAQQNNKFIYLLIF